MMKLNETIKKAYNNCKTEEWLQYDDERYIPFSKRSLRGKDGDIVADMHRTIQMSDDATHLLMSGFRGSGKTTELKRLAHMLEKNGFSVAFIDTEEYLNLREPATVSDLWISIAAGFDQFIEETLGERGALGKFWDRFTQFMNREVKISGAKISIPQGIECQVALRDNPSFREQLNAALEPRRPEMVKECRNFVEEGVAHLKKANPDTSGVVIVIDSFEKLQGNSLNAEEVRISVETLFTRDWNLLQTPCHAIYTVPPWLAFTEAGVNTELERTRLLPMCKIKESDESPCEDGIQALFDLLGKRMDLDHIFGDREIIRPIIEQSGGYPRDLLRMTRELLQRLSSAESLPAPSDKLKADVARIIEIYIELYETGLDGDDIPLLVDIAGGNDISGWSRKEKFRLAELFEHHFVLSYQNGKRWLDIHPLLRETESLKKALREKPEEA